MALLDNHTSPLITKLAEGLWSGILKLHFSKNDGITAKTFNYGNNSKVFNLDRKLHLA